MKRREMIATFYREENTMQTGSDAAGLGSKLMAPMNDILDKHRSSVLPLLVAAKRRRVPRWPTTKRCARWRPFAIPCCRACCG